MNLKASLQDWKRIISMLLDENPSIELTDEDTTNLTRLLCASVKKSVGERIVPATDSRKQYYNKAQRVSFSLLITLSSKITLEMQYILLVCLLHLFLHSLVGFNFTPGIK